jgi:hypothetical protein
MASTPEKKVKDSCVKLIKSYDAYYFYPVMTGFGRSGIPDIICCVSGKFLAIECKAGDNKPTALQERELQKITEAGGVSLVINEANLTMLDEILKGLTHGKSKP